MNVFDRFVLENGVSVEIVDNGLCDPDGEVPASWLGVAHEYHVAISRHSEHYEFPFFTSQDHPSPVTLAEVVESMQSECQGALGNTFEEWADDLGVDSDSRKAECIYLACRDLALGIRRVLGQEAFAAFLALDAGADD